MTVNQGSVGTAHANGLGFNPSPNVSTPSTHQAAFQPSFVSRFGVAQQDTATTNNNSNNNNSNSNNNGSNSSSINVTSSHHLSLPKASNPSIISSHTRNNNLAAENLNNNNTNLVSIPQRLEGTHFRTAPLSFESTVCQLPSSTPCPVTQTPSFSPYTTVSQHPSSPTSSPTTTLHQYSSHICTFPNSNSSPTQITDFHATYIDMVPVRAPDACLVKEELPLIGAYDNSPLLSNSLHHSSSHIHGASNNSLQSLEDYAISAGSNNPAFHQTFESDSLFKYQPGILPGFSALYDSLRPHSDSSDDPMDDLSLHNGLSLRHSSSNSSNSNDSYIDDSCDQQLIDLETFDFPEDSAISMNFFSSAADHAEFEYLKVDSFLPYPGNAIMKTEPMDDQAFGTSDIAFLSDTKRITPDSADAGYDSDPPHSSSIHHQGYYDQFSDNHRTFQPLPGHSSWPRQRSPESDEGFEEEQSVPVAGNFPDFEKIQHTSTEAERSPPSRRTSSSPKEKRKGSSSPQVAEKERRKPGRKPGQVSNVLHLWEFMRDLLHSEDSKGIIEWISEQEGVFRVINSTEVARLWGKKKKNKKEMTYEKLSRSLRYSRLEGYFSNLPKDKNYPKKLCFKFGPKSKDWHRY